MGIEDRLRKLEREQTRKDALDAQRAATVQDRAVRANQLLQELGSETLAVLQNREYPRAIEILSVSLVSNFFGHAPPIIRVKTGRTFTLATKSHRWGQQFFGWVLGESGELLDSGSAEVPHAGLAWVHGDSYALGARRVPKAMSEKVKSVAERAGCAAAVTGVRPVVAYGEPQQPTGDYTSSDSFFLSDSGKLMYGDANFAKEAADFVAERILG